jgi:ComF family protein
MNWIEHFLDWGSSLPDLLYPRTCAVCGNSLFLHESVICLSCKFHLPVTGYHENPDNKAAMVFWGRVRFEHCSSFLAYRKGNSVQHLIHALKYKNRQDIGEYLGSMYGLALKKTDSFLLPDGLIPVPLHPKKERKRGYNQSLMIAKGLSEALNVPVFDKMVVRRTHGESQTKKDRYSRWENAQERFELKDRMNANGKHLLLVDDVITTGSTLEAMAAVFSELPTVNLSAVSLGFAC